MGKLNTLLGLSPNPNQAMQPNSGGQHMFAGGPGGDPSSAWRPTGGGGVQQMIPGGSHQMYGPQQMYAGGPGGNPQGGGNMQLRQILALRAQHGDTQAARMLGMV